VVLLAPYSAFGGEIETYGCQGIRKPQFLWGGGASLSLPHPLKTALRKSCLNTNLQKRTLSWRVEISLSTLSRLLSAGLLAQQNGRFSELYWLIILKNRFYHIGQSLLF
jgi:hypothetical protein